MTCSGDALSPEVYMNNKCFGKVIMKIHSLNIFDYQSAQSVKTKFEHWSRVW